MGFPTLHVGQSNPERDAEITAKCAQLLAEGLRTDDVCAELGLTRQQLAAARKRHTQREEFDLFVALDDRPCSLVRVCHVTTTKNFSDTCVDVFRAYKNTLQKLGLPNWCLTDRRRRVRVSDLQQALMSGKVVAKLEKNRARRRLGMREVR